MNRRPVRTTRSAIRPLPLISRLALPSLLLMTFPAAAPAGQNAGAAILLHLGTPTVKNPCTGPLSRPACTAVVTQGFLYPAFYYAYLLVADGDAAAGVAGVACGIEYGSQMLDGVGVDIFGWQSCSSFFEMPDPGNGWPRSGTGNILTWDAVNACQRFEPGGAGTGVTATAAYFYLTAYSDAVFSVTPHPADNLARVADCQAVEDILEGGGVHHVPSRLGAVGFGGATGFNPCAGVPAQRTTWGAIKALDGRR